MRLLASVLRRFVQKGTLNIVAADGRRHLFEGKSPGPCLTIRLHDRSLHTRLALNPELYAGEAYMNGTLTFEDGSNVGDLMELFSVNRSGLAAHGLQKLLRQVRLGLRRWHQANRFCKGRGAFRTICFKPHPYSTWGEAETIGRMARLRGWRSVVVVSSTYHIFRAKLLFRRCFAGRVDAVGARPRLHDFVWKQNLVTDQRPDRRCSG